MVVEEGSAEAAQIRKGLFGHDEELGLGVIE